MDAYSTDFISLASSRMVRQTVRQHKAYQPPRNDGMFAQLLDRLFKAENEEVRTRMRLDQARSRGDQGLCPMSCWPPSPFVVPTTLTTRKDAT